MPYINGNNSSKRIFFRLIERKWKLFSFFLTAIHQVLMEPSRLFVVSEKLSNNINKKKMKKKYFGRYWSICSRFIATRTSVSSVLLSWKHELSQQAKSFKPREFRPFHGSYHQSIVLFSDTYKSDGEHVSVNRQTTLVFTGRKNCEFRGRAFKLGSITTGLKTVWFSIRNRNH